MGANFHKLVYHGKTTQNSPVTHMDVASQLGVISKNGVVSYLSIVCQVHVGHEPVVVTDPRDAGIAG